MTRKFERDTAGSIKIGDFLKPDPIWNNTTGGLDYKLPDVCKVLKIERIQSQTSYVLTVRSKTGMPISLDAGWFINDNCT